MKTVFGLMAMGFFAWSSFGQAADSKGSTSTATTTTAAASMPSDAQIVKVLDTANKAEVDAAKLALKNAKSSEVKDFAQHMVDEHTKNNDQGKTIAKDEKISPKDFARAKEIQKDADSKMSALKNARGNDFDRAYISSQVDMHKQVLNDLDNTLIPAAKDSKLKSFLETTKSHVQQHLDQAQKLQASMK